MVERPILRGAPDAIVAPPRPYGPRLHADRAQQNLNQASVYALPGSGSCELGHGTLAERLLRSHLPSDAHYSSIDLSPRMHELARRRLDAYVDRVELRLGNALPHLP